MNCFTTFKFITLGIASFGLASCSEHSTSPSVQTSPKTDVETATKCEPPPIAVNVGSLLDAAWGKNAAGAFPFTKGGPEPAPGNVELRLALNFKMANNILVLTSITGSTAAGDKVYLPAIQSSPAMYSPPIGGYTETPAQYQESGCDSIWSKGEPGPGSLATQNSDGSYKAQCASFAMNAIPVAFTQAEGRFSSSLTNPALSSFVDDGKTGWFDPNTGKVVVSGKTYGLVSRGWEIAERLQKSGAATFTAAQMPWANGIVGNVSPELVKSQIAKFGATESTSGSDYTYRTEAYSQEGKWIRSNGHFSVGIPKSGPGRLSGGVAMFRVEGAFSQDKKTVSVTNFSYSGPMLVCPADGQECTASPGRSFTGLTCSASM